jgi:hypothetical protein
MKKNTVIMFFVFLFVIMMSFAEGSESEALKGIKVVRVSVSTIQSDFGFTENDIKNHVHSKLKTLLSSLTIDTNLTSSIPFLLHIQLDINKRNGSAHAYLEVTAKRTVFLPDKETSLFARVWEKNSIFGESSNQIYSTTKKQLDKLLDDFAYDYLKAQE